MASAIKGLTTLAQGVSRLLSSSGDALDVAQGAEKMLPGAFAALLAGPGGGALIGLAAGALGAVSIYTDYIQGRSLDELKKHSETIRRELAAAWARSGQQAREVADVAQFDSDGKLQLDRLPEPQRYNPYLVLYAVLRHGFTQDEQRYAELARLLQAQEDFRRRLAPYLDSALGILHRQGTQIRRELAQLRVAVAEAAKRELELLENTRHYPPLRLTTYTYDPDSAESDGFNYRARRLPLYGRADELAELRAFRDSDQTFSWWLWTGPGGAGKSRLALEFCLESISADWHAGFLSDHRTFKDWDRWQPDAPTLIVVDYAARRATDMAQAIDVLAGRAPKPKLDNKVRILLLERDGGGNEQWWREFLNAAPAQETLRLRHHRQTLGPAAARPLGEPGDDALASILEDVLHERGVSPPEDAEARQRWRRNALESFRAVDPQRRALFAMFAAEAVAAETPGATVRGPDADPLAAIRQWDAQRLVRFVLDREWKRRWQPAAEGLTPALAEKHVNAVVLATLLGGADKEYVWRLADEPALAQVLPQRREFDADFYRVLTGYSRVGEPQKLPPLEPDVLGECLLLERLGCGWRVADGGDPDVVKADAATLRDRAWADHLFACAATIFRALTDFPLEAAIAELIAVPMTDRYQASLLAAIIADATPTLVRAGSERHLDSVVDRLRALRYPEFPLFNAATARIFFNRGVTHGQLGRTEEEIADYTAVLSLPDAPAEQRAQALNNRGVVYGRLGRTDQAIADFSDVLSLLDAPAEQRAKALYNRGLTHGRLGRTVQAIADYTAVLSLPDAPAEQRAQALYNRGVVYGRLGLTDQASADCVMLLALADDAGAATSRWQPAFQQAIAALRRAISENRD